jgi:hypothetical protein
MPHPISNVPIKLAERLRNANSTTNLYVDYFYFVLDIDNFLEFWFNNNQFIDRIEKNKIPSYVIEYLITYCPKFTDFYKNNKISEDSTAQWKPNNLYSQNIPRIGNAYSAMIYKIVTEKDCERNKRVIHIYQDWGSSLMADFETIGEKEVDAFLTLTIYSETHKTIKSVYELDCFKNVVNDFKV